VVCFSHGWSGGRKRRRRRIRFLYIYRSGWRGKEGGVETHNEMKN